MLAVFRQRFLKESNRFGFIGLNTLGALSIAFVVVVLAVLQDYLHSQRNGYAFFLHESLIFKSVWWLFIPTFFAIKHWVKRNPQLSFCS